MPMQCRGMGSMGAGSIGCANGTGKYIHPGDPTNVYEKFTITHNPLPVSRRPALTHGRVTPRAVSCSALRAACRPACACATVWVHAALLCAICAAPGCPLLLLLLLLRMPAARHVWAGSARAATVHITVFGAVCDWTGELPQL